MIAAPAIAFGQGLGEKWERLRHREINGWAMPYRLFRSEAKGKLPLVVYLHGAAGLGADNEKQIAQGNAIPANLWVLPENQRRYPCHVVAPQTDRGWIRYATPRVPGGPRPEPAAGIGEGAAAAADLITRLMAELDIDASRVYVTGQSMGGGGTWHMIAHFGNLIAAAISYCGGVTKETGAENPGIPVWNFHGTADATVPVSVSRERMAARGRARGTPRYTEYEGVGHGVSPRACAEPELPGWLFSQRRG
jgi:predicted peptidase